MFTGIVRETGRVVELARAGDGLTLRFECGLLFDSLRPGHSISVDGVCLTVTRKAEGWVSVDVTPETLRRTNLGLRTVGDALNLEPAALLSDFLGGHLVQGHVDATGTVESIEEVGNSWIFRISTPPEVMQYCVFKGSIALNGISLTIAAMGQTSFEVAIIPHTMEVTNMSELRPGDSVNLEADLISKYVERHVQRYLNASGSDPSDADRAAARS